MKTLDAMKCVKSLIFTDLILVKRNVLSSENTEGERMRRERLYGRWTNNKLWINETSPQTIGQGVYQDAGIWVDYLIWRGLIRSPVTLTFGNEQEVSLCMQETIQTQCDINTGEEKSNYRTLRYAFTHKKQSMGAGNLIPKSSGKIFQYYSTSVISFINGVMFLSMSGFFFFDICQELSHQWPWDWQICLGTWSWARESVWVSLRLPQMIWLYSKV